MQCTKKIIALNSGIYFWFWDDKHVNVAAFFGSESDGEKEKEKDAHAMDRQTETGTERLHQSQLKPFSEEDLNLIQLQGYFG